MSVSYQNKRLSFSFSLIAKSPMCAKCSASNWVQNEMGAGGGGVNIENEQMNLIAGFTVRC